ncbi:MAG: energy transducer TonB [Acidobacteriota bacterium]|nr:energy transducer TonB [Acidobacteriota bacterium]
MKPLSLALAIALSATALAAQNWRDELRMVENDLRSQHYAHARKWSIKAINSMTDHLGTGRDATFTLALTVAYRAMAEQGLQKPEDAHWYWHVATDLYPPFADKDWSSFGEVGEWFTAQKTVDKIAEDLPDAVVTKKIEPKCPLSAIQGAYYQPVTVSATIDGDGFARCPKIASPTNAPTLAYAALESLKQWQFQPVSAKYQVTMNFAPPAE